MDIMQNHGSPEIARTLEMYVIWPVLTQILYATELCSQSKMAKMANYIKEKGQVMRDVTLKKEKAALKKKKPASVPAEQRWPHLYTPQLADEILKRLSEGKTLSEICRDSAMPSRAGVSRWVVDDVDGFRDRYAHARDVGYDVMAENLIEIADNSAGDCAGYDDDDNPRPNNEFIQRSRIKIDTRKWLLAKWASKKYGDRQVVEHEGNLSLAVMLNEAKERVGEDKAN